MNTVFLNGLPVHTYGVMPHIGERCPHFRLVNTDFETVTDDRYRGRRIILNIFPSLDTTTCAMSVRQFNMRVASLHNVMVFAISADLPFAAARFCTNENIEHVIHLSTFRNRQFGRDMGLELIDGPLQGLLARAVICLDEEHNILYRELISEITDEPNYNAAIEALSLVWF